MRSELLVVELQPDAETTPKIILVAKLVATSPQLGLTRAARLRAIAQIEGEDSTSHRRATVACRQSFPSWP